MSASNTMHIFNTLPPESIKILSAVSSLIEKTFPIPGRFRGKLPSQVAELSRLLTGARGDRSLSYLSRPPLLSAYLNYYLPWNLLRLCYVLSGFDKKFSAGDSIVDLGCGPLTFASALWITRTDLRGLALEFFCIDRSSPVLEAGKKFFTALAGEETPWKIHLVKEDIDFRKASAQRGIILPRRTRSYTVLRTGTEDTEGRDGVSHKKNRAALVCAVNIFNEIYENLAHTNTTGLRRMADNAAAIMHDMAKENACILIMEPGVPQSGHFISFLRSAFLELGRAPLSPCPHNEACPLGGEKKRWCHFALEPLGAPKELLRLSAAAGIPKERLVFSFLLAGAAVEAKNFTTNQHELVPAERTRTCYSTSSFCSRGEEGFNYAQEEGIREKGAIRVISDAFALPNMRFGRYGCSSAGLVLLAGGKSRIERLSCGSLVCAALTGEEARDTKSGAVIIDEESLK